jgi:hypothetical protein
LTATWKELGGDYEKFAIYDYTRNLRALADATQQIYLGLPSFAAWRQAQLASRMAHSESQPKS